MAQSLTDGGSGRRPDERAKHIALIAVETVARLEKGLHRGVGLSLEIAASRNIVRIAVRVRQQENQAAQ